MKKSLSFAVSALASLPILFTATSGNAADFDYADLIDVRGDVKDASLVGGKVTLDGFAAELSYEYSQYLVAADLLIGANLSLSADKGVAVSLRKGPF